MINWFEKGAEPAVPKKWTFENNRNKAITLKLRNDVIVTLWRHNYTILKENRNKIFYRLDHSVLFEYLLDPGQWSRGQTGRLKSLFIHRKCCSLAIIILSRILEWLMGWWHWIGRIGWLSSECWKFSSVNWGWYFDWSQSYWMSEFQRTRTSGSPCCCHLIAIRSLP